LSREPAEACPRALTISVARSSSDKTSACEWLSLKAKVSEYPPLLGKSAIDFTDGARVALPRLEFMQGGRDRLMQAHPI